MSTSRRSFLHALLVAPLAGVLPKAAAASGVDQLIAASRATTPVLVDLIPRKHNAMLKTWSSSLLAQAAQESRIYGKGSGALILPSEEAAELGYGSITLAPYEERDDDQ